MAGMTEREWLDQSVVNPDGYIEVREDVSRTPWSPKQPWEAGLKGAVEAVGVVLKKLQQRIEEKIAAREARVDKHVDLVDPLTTLPERVQTLEERHERSLADAYQSGFAPNTTYKRGAVISHNGGLWLAMSSTSERPGSTEAWRLILRSER